MTRRGPRGEGRSSRRAVPHASPARATASIELAVAPGRAAGAQRLDAFAARRRCTSPPRARSAGPARRHCLRRGWSFTTAFHTTLSRDPGRARCSVPDVAGAMRCSGTSTRPSSGVMVPTARHARACCERSGFAQPAAVVARRRPGAVRVPLARRADLGRCRGRSSCTSAASRTRRTSRPSCDLDLPGSKVVYGVGPLLERSCKRALSRTCTGAAWCRATSWRSVYSGGRRVRLPQPRRDLRAGDAGGHGLRHAGGGLSRWPARSRCWAGAMRRRRAAWAAPCTKTCGRPASRRWPCPAHEARRARAGFQLAARRCDCSPASWCPRGRRPRRRRDCHDTVIDSMTAVVIPFSTGVPEAASAAPDIPFLDRDHSILAFNERVLDWARRADVPLLERLRYLCIVSSNLDEFFEVRADAASHGAAERRPQGRVHGPIVRGAGGGGAQAGRRAVRALQRRADAGLRPRRHRNRFARRPQRGAEAMGARVFRARGPAAADSRGAGSGPSVSAGGQQVAELHRSPGRQGRLRPRERDRHRQGAARAAAPDPDAAPRSRARRRCSSRSPA